MPKPLSLDLRKRVVAAYESGKGTMQHVATAFSIGVATVVRLMALKRNTGCLAPKRHGGGQSSTLSEHDIEQLKALIQETPDLRLAGFAEALEERIHKKVTVDIVFRVLRKIDYTHKKKRPIR